MKSCDAFVLYFLGVGEQGGTVTMADNRQAAIYNEILPLFNTENCDMLSGKPKLFMFHLADGGRWKLLLCIWINIRSRIFIWSVFIDVIVISSLLIMLITFLFAIKLGKRNKLATALICSKHPSVTAAWSLFFCHGDLQRCHLSCIRQEVPVFRPSIRPPGR